MDIDTPGIRRGLIRVFRVSAFAAVLVLGVVSVVVFPRISRAIVQSNGWLPPTQPSQSGLKQSDAETVPGEILVRFRSDSVIARTKTRAAFQLEQGERQIPVQVERLSEAPEIVEGLRLARVAPDQTTAAIRALRSRPDVLYAEPNYIWHRSSTIPNDPRFSEQWGLLRPVAPGDQDNVDIDVDKAWDITTGNSNVVVGVLDGGIDISHQDLQENIWTNPGEIPGNGIDDDGNGLVDDVHGWDFHHNDNTVFDNEDGDDHGTHVAGIIGARGNNSLGIAGVCWNVSVLPVKVLGPNGGSISNIIAGYGYVKNLRARGVNIRVLNNSYGGRAQSQAAADAISQLSQAGILFIVAAGNEHRDTFRYPEYPANYDLPNVIAVAATQQTSGIPSFSSFGERKVALAAPGADILSTTPNNTYRVASGTSMAAPHVSGVAALVIAAVPGISLSALKGALIYSNAAPGTTAVKGFLNANKAILAALENDVMPPAPPANLHVLPPFPNGRNVEIDWLAPGDDGNVGMVANYDLTFITPNGEPIPIPISVNPQPAGSSQSLINIPVPIGNPSGTFELRAYDNVGNSASSTFPVSVNVDQGVDPYVVTLSPNSTLSTGGQRLVLDGDDQYAPFNLPTDFSTLPGGGTSIFISTNGVIHFSQGPPVTFAGVKDDIPGSVEYLTGLPMLAGLWDDLVIDATLRPDAGVFVVQPNPLTFIFRWQANSRVGLNPINFEVELRSSGTIVCRYGDGNQDVSPVVGLSFGEPDAYVVPSHTREYWRSGPRLNLGNAQTVTFTKRVPLPAVGFEFSLDNYQTAESVGSVTVVVTRPVNTPNGFPILGTQTVSYLTSAGTALTNSDYVESSGSVSFERGEGSKRFTVPILGDALSETAETFNLTLSNPSNGVALGARRTATVTIFDSSPPASTVQFGSASNNLNEGAGFASIPVNRTGDISAPAAINYATSDTAGANNCNTVNGVASSRCDYLTTLGTLQFAAGETIKTISIPIVDDVYAEGNESFTITLSDATGTALSAPAVATLTINDNDSVNGTSNPLDEAGFFVGQHYGDFLNRAPDASGLNFWTNEITQCGVNAACTELKRINVSGAFFLSIEFQETGYLVYRIYKSAFGTLRNAPVPVRFNEFLRDTQQIGQGVQVGVGNWQTQLEANKQAFALAFVQRPEFLVAFPNNLPGDQFVTHLDANAGGVLSISEQGNLIALLGNNSADVGRRALVLRSFVEDADFKALESNRAFVLMQYFGYLRRNPNDAPDSDFSGYSFWLNKLNQFNGNFVNAEMVKAFINAIEYRRRFGP